MEFILHTEACQGFRIMFQAILIEFSNFMKYQGDKTILSVCGFFFLIKRAWGPQDPRYNSRVSPNNKIACLFSSTLGSPGAYGAVLHHLNSGISGVCDGDEVHPLCPWLIDQVSTGDEWRNLLPLCWSTLPGPCFLDHQRCYN